MVVVVVVGGVVVVVVVVVGGVVVVVVVEGTTINGIVVPVVPPTVVVVVGGTVLVVVVVDGTAPAVVVVVVVGTVVTVVPATVGAVPEGAGAVITTVVQAPAFCMVATSATIRLRECRSAALSDAHVRVASVNAPAASPRRDERGVDCGPCNTLVGHQVGRGDAQVLLGDHTVRVLRTVRVDANPEVCERGARRTTAVHVLVDGKAPESTGRAVGLCPCGGQL